MIPMKIKKIVDIIRGDKSVSMLNSINRSKYVIIFDELKVPSAEKNMSSEDLDNAIAFYMLRF